MTKWYLFWTAKIIQHTENNTIYHINRIKGQGDTVISIDEEKIVEKIQIVS